MLTAASYARYSSDRQKATSIEDQVARARKAAPQFDCRVVDDYIYSDREITGTIDQRIDYVRLIADAKARKFQAIIVEAQDRLWRDQGEMHKALKQLRFWGIKVFDVSTGTELTSKTGKLMASVMGWKDEAYIEDLRDKTHRGMHGQFGRGFAVGGRGYGYGSKQVLNTEGEIIGSHRVVDQDEAKVFRRICEMYAGGMGPRAISLRLNAERVPPPRTSRGRPLGWTPATIAGSSTRAFGILHNPICVGRMVWNRSQNVRDPDTGRRTQRLRPKSEWEYVNVPHLRIISDDLWNAVQKRHADQSRAARGNKAGRRPRYLFSGLLVCDECGQHYVIRSNDPKKHGYYGCASNTNRGPGICPNGRLVRRDRLEELLLRQIFDEVFSQDTVAYVSRKVNEALARLADPPGAARKKLEAELAKARGELENIKSAIRQGILTPTTKAMLEEAEERVGELESALKASVAKRSNVAVLPSVVEGYLRDLRGSLGHDTERARELLAKLLGPITLRRDGGKLIAEMRGNLPALLEMDETLYNPGAGGRT